MNRELSDQFMSVTPEPVNFKGNAHGLQRQTIAIIAKLLKLAWTLSRWP
jgi:hypothetical protein